MRVTIIGANGSMGKRYSAILKSLRVDYYCIDIDTEPELSQKYLSEADCFIICSPTDTHYKIAKLLIRFQRPILCEKPISKNIDEVREILELAEDYGTPFQMVSQYVQAVEIAKTLGLTLKDQKTYYDYYHTGKDGLAWDCIQIIALANETPRIDAHSPTWECAINGVKLNKDIMDRAYVEMIKDWLYRPDGDADFILLAHEKVREIDDKLKKCTDSYTGKDYLN